MNEILAMSGVQFIGIIQKYDVIGIVTSVLIELFCIGVIILSSQKARKSRDAFYLFCIAFPAILFSIMIFGGPFLRAIQKENYVQVRVLHDSEAAFRILEEYDDVEIDGSTFTIKLDNPRKDE